MDKKIDRIDRQINRFVYRSWMLRDKTMNDVLMYIPKDDKQNYPFKSLNTDSLNQSIKKHLK